MCCNKLVRRLTAQILYNLMQDCIFALGFDGGSHELIAFCSNTESRSFFFPVNHIQIIQLLLEFLILFIGLQPAVAVVRNVLLSFIQITDILGNFSLMASLGHEKHIRSSLQSLQLFQVFSLRDLHNLTAALLVIHLFILFFVFVAEGFIVSRVEPLGSAVSHQIIR